MRTQPETRARSSQEAGKRALNLWGSKANQACTFGYMLAPTPHHDQRLDADASMPRGTAMRAARRAAEAAEDIVDR